jgi:DNA-binding IclR family transcriptional regulator
VPPRTTDPVSVGARLIALLDAFTARASALTLSELSRRTGLPLTSTHRLVGELAAGGLLERGDDGRYRIGLRLWEIASLASRGIGLRESALPFLEDLYEATHQHVQLAVLEGHEVLYLERISGRDAVSIISRVGGRLAPHATGVGVVLLAHAPVDVQDAILAAPLRRFTDRTETRPSELRRILADVRRDGYAITDGTVETVALSVAAPVRGPDDSVIAAISVVVPAESARPREIVPAVVAAARGISRVLGAPSSQRLARTVRRETHRRDLQL